MDKKIIKFPTLPINKEHEDLVEKYIEGAENKEKESTAIKASIKVGAPLEFHGHGSFDVDTGYVSTPEAQPVAGHPVEYRTQAQSRDELIESVLKEQREVLNRIPFQTTLAEIRHLFRIAFEMKSKDTLDEDFILEAVDVAVFDQGVYDLMNMWMNFNSSNSFEEMEFCICDIKESIKDYKSNV